MPSSLASNEQQDIMLDTDDLEFDTENFENNAYYKFEEEFENRINLFTIEKASNTIEAIFSVKGEATYSEHIIQDRNSKTSNKYKRRGIIWKNEFPNER